LPPLPEEDFAAWPDADSVVCYRTWLNVGSVFGLSGYVLDFFASPDNGHVWRCYRRALSQDEAGYIRGYGSPELLDSDGGGTSPCKNGYEALSAECLRIGQLLCPAPGTGPTKRQAGAARRRRAKQVKADEALADAISDGNGAA
jgi:hypothetical protein